MNINDEKILALRKQIAEKKKEINNKRFIPQTNCMYSGTNIQTMDMDTLIMLACSLNNVIETAQRLNLPEPRVNGYFISLWLEDVLAKISHLSNVSKQSELNAMEKKLSTMLTSDTQISLELLEIEKQLR